MMAFMRQWDTKPAILVVTNMSPNNATVSVVSDQGLKDKDGNVLKKAKVRRALCYSLKTRPAE